MNNELNDLKSKLGSIKKLVSKMDHSIDDMQVAGLNNNIILDARVDAQLATLEGSINKVVKTISEGKVVKSKAEILNTKCQFSRLKKLLNEYGREDNEMVTSKPIINRKSKEDEFKEKLNEDELYLFNIMKGLFKKVE